MNISAILKRTEKVITDNSPLLLTAVGVAGTITTAVLTHKAALRAHETLENVTGPELTTKEKVKITYKLYIPALATGSLTVAAIVGANHIGTRRAAAVAAAYTISEKAMEEYKAKVIEKIGETKEQEVRDELAQDRVNRAHKPAFIVSDDEGKVMCHDAMTDRFFMCDMQTLRSAVNSINEQILHADYATLDEFYEYIGLPSTSVSGEMGWNTNALCQVSYSTTMYKENTPCISFEFAVVPVRDPWRFC